MASCHCGAGLLAEHLCLPGCCLVGRRGLSPLSVWVQGLPPSSWVFDVGSGCCWTVGIMPLASELGGRQPQVTDNCLGAKVARGFLSRWEGMASVAGSQPALTPLVPRRKNQGYLHLITVPSPPPWDTSFTFPLKGSRNLGIIYFNTVVCFTRFPSLAISS